MGSYVHGGLGMRACALLFTIAASVAVTFGQQPNSLNVEYKRPIQRYVDLRLTTDKRCYEPYEPVRIKLSFQNKSKRTVYHVFPTDLNPDSLSLRFKKPGGEFRTFTYLPRFGRDTRGIRFPQELAPGEKFDTVEIIVLRSEESKELVLDRPGVYEFKLHYEHIPSRKWGEGNGRLDSNVVRLSVEDRATVEIPSLYQTEAMVHTIQRDRDLDKATLESLSEAVSGLPESVYTRIMQSALQWARERLTKPGA